MVLIKTKKGEEKEISLIDVPAAVKGGATILTKGVDSKKIASHLAEVEKKYVKQAGKGKKIKVDEKKDK